MEVYNDENALAEKGHVLSRLASSYRRAGRADFIEFLNNDVRGGLSKTDDLYAVTLELENRFLMREGYYQKAIDNFTSLKTDFAENETNHKNALFGLGYIHYVLLEDFATGRKYFDELVTTYPDDKLMTPNAILLIGDGDNIYESTENFQSALSKQEPDRYGLIGNYPNPFNPETRIRYSLPEESHVRLTIYNIRGER
jgi:tetratricopeptide (TPR) repeat protein